MFSLQRHYWICNTYCKNIINIPKYRNFSKSACQWKKSPLFPKHLKQRWAKKQDLAMKRMIGEVTDYEVPKTR